MDIFMSDSISAKELTLLKSTQQKDLIRAVMVDNPDVEPLARAMLSRLDESLVPNPSTAPEWMIRATTVLSLSVLNLSLPQKHQLPLVPHRDSERSGYTLPPGTGSFLEILKPFTCQRGWVDVVDNALKLVRREKSPSSSMSSQALTLYSSNALKPDPSKAIQSLFHSTSYLLKRTDIDKIMLNINFAAIHLALLHAGIIEYKSSFEMFKKDVELCFRHVNFDWEGLNVFQKLYKTGSTLQLPLQLAVIISPTILLRKMALFTQHTNREYLFTVARALGSSTPPLLQRINGAIWSKLLNVAQGTKTARELLFELSQEFSEEELRNVTNIDAHFFFPDPPEVLPASNMLKSSAMPDSPFPQCTTPPASPLYIPETLPMSSSPLSGCSTDSAQDDVEDLSSDQGLRRPSAALRRRLYVSPLNFSIPESLASGTSSPPNSPAPKNPIASLDSGPSRTAVTPSEIVIQSTKVSSTPKSLEPNSEALEAPIETRRSKRRVSLTAEMPQFEPRPAPQATRNRALKQNRKAKTAATTSSARRKGRRIVAVKSKSTKERNTATLDEITPESRALTIEPEVHMTGVDPKTSLSAKTEATDLTLNHYSHHTKRLRYTKDPVDVYSYDGRAVFRFQPALYSETQHQILQNLMEEINHQAGRDKCDDSIPINEWVDLPCAAPTPDSFPIYETEYRRWINLSASQQQFIFKKQHVLLHDCPVKSYKFDLATFRELLGNPDTTHTMHDVSLAMSDTDSDSNSDSDLANRVHVDATFRNMVEAVQIRSTAQNQSKILNALNIPLPGKSPTPPGSLFTGVEAESHTLGTDGFLASASRAWREWALAAHTDAFHAAHIDTGGLLTHIAPMTGIKGWGIAEPVDRSHFGSIDAFGEDYDIDLSNSQGWNLYSFLLRPGDWFIMRPCTPHFALTLEDSICLGGHDYCSQTFPDSAFGIFHTFTQSGWLTNTTHLEAFESHQRIIAYYHREIMKYHAGYEELLSLHGDVEKKDGSHVILHLPNFNIADDVIGFLYLHNLIQLGSILDFRRYNEAQRQEVEQQNLGSDRQDSEVLDADLDYIPDHMQKQYQDAKNRSNAILNWLVRHFQLALVNDRTAEEECPDGLLRADRLIVMSDAFLVQQCRALLLEKWEAETSKIQGEALSVTAWRICSFMEEDWADDDSFMSLWPGERGESFKMWINSWGENDPRSYAFPLAPPGFRYKIIRV